MAVTTTRLIIVCTEAVRDQMNATLNSIDPESTGDVMTAGLALPADPYLVVGYWTSWAMPARHKSSILAAFNSAGWAPLRGSEGVVHHPGDTLPAWGTQRFWMFDGMTWTRVYDVTDALGLAPVRGEE